jgi:hypothetical protein
LKAGETALDRVNLSGPAPWWLGFPGSKLTHMPSGSRGFVIRSYKATFGGKSHNLPTLSLPVGEVGADGKCHVDAAIVPPAGVENYLPGDSVEMEIEVDVIPAEADDYYGPNEAFREHLAKNPGSWKSFHRAAASNDLQIEVQGGTLLRNFPVVIQADPGADMVFMKIQGGAGAVPVRFEGLETPAGWQLGRMTSDEKPWDQFLPLAAKLSPALASKLAPQIQPLDQSVHGNDFWETALDPDSGTYSLTFNLPLDATPSSVWILKKSQ